MRLTSLLLSTAVGGASSSARGLSAVRKVALASAVLGLSAVGASAQVVIFTETVGSASGTQSIAANTFDNADLTFTGTGDTRSTGVSSGYTGATGGRNVFLTNNGTASFQISGIDTSGYEVGSLDLTFGGFKSTTASDMSELVVSYSTNGVDFTPLALTAQASGSGTANWRLVTVAESTLIPSSSTLSIRWVNTSTSPQFRVDDITLTGVAIPEPGTYAALAGLAVLSIVGLRRRRI